MRVLDQDAAYLRFLEQHHLTPGSTVVIESRDAAAEAVLVKGTGDTATTIRWRAASRIQVRKA